MNEMVEHARNIAQAVDIPVLADGDTGYGNPLNIRRTVSEYEQAGVCAIQLEDQVFPKRCGHMLGRKVIAMEEMVQKIKAATDARQDEDFVIIARTDARTSFGLEEALRRGQAYRDAGADVIFIESPENVEELKAINEAFRGTPLANMIEGGRTGAAGQGAGGARVRARHLPDRSALRRDQGGQGLHGRSCRRPEPRWAGSTRSRSRTSTSSSACPSMSGSRSATGSDLDRTAINTNPDQRGSR